MFQQFSTVGRNNLFFVAAVGILFLQITGCSKSGGESNATALRLATTTSTRDSGLLNVLLPVFESQNNCRVDVIAVGTGAALKIGEAGDADILLVHARKAEEAFINAGHGTRHEEFMYNDFVILGPVNDPASIRDTAPVEALKKIAEGNHWFVSRGDDSGTHKREMSLWEAGGGRRTWKNYLESGQGMGPSLVMANEKLGYVLVDMGTYLKFKEKIDLIPLAAPSESLRNPYAVIVVNSEKHSNVNNSLANALVNFLVSRETQQLIAEYHIAGQQLYFPTRLVETK